MERALFGRKSEKQHLYSPEQTRLFEIEESKKPEQLQEEVIEAYKRVRLSKKEVQDYLHIEEIAYEPEETECSQCGSTLEEFSRDIREELEFNPMRFFRRNPITVLCSRPKCQEVIKG